ncbi:MAG: hypothetical protein UZ15_CFX003003067 [Chloroflexi bacterium OLB15]|nr:MAG: hypothetical protein UZ15_CFX003003067 [Chloroflexi bacterium OLB15]
MRDHHVDKTSGDGKRSVQRAQAGSQSAAKQNSIIGLQGIIGNKAVQRVMASSGAIQRVKTIDDDVHITGNLTAGTVSSNNNAMVWGDMYVVGNKGTVVANNTPVSAVPAGGESGGAAQGSTYNPTEL